ncbi:DUF2589 domain-containing protein [Sphingomonas sp. RP10(2022)]|uniref:DUF2589 domain-containing protein n=1 Tax=Sphingomonas liriopis TaxID=2949094 RepID=A0A9X2HRJ4_9SPHN|nr:DUF2589 domain-containing protein [Sphingomonas liriopis]MCP3735167.1 DUF2589 domain-containing protein [Sphingomonas liriopis]
MPINMGDQFRGLPMGDLIGGPLMAACDAQVRLANATAQFIQQIGFVPRDPPAGNTDTIVFDPAKFDTRNVAFKFNRPKAGAVADASGNIPSETVELDVPLLAIVKVPALGIDTVDITFDMEVKNSERSSETEEKKGSFAADASVGWGPFSLKVHVEGSVATHKENTRQTDQSAKYHVQVRATDKGMPEGLARVLDMMNSAIAPKTISDAAAPEKGSQTGPARAGTVIENPPQRAGATVAAGSGGGEQTGTLRMDDGHAYDVKLKS